MQKGANAAVGGFSFWLDLNLETNLFGVGSDSVCLEVGRLGLGLLGCLSILECCHLPCFVQMPLS